MSDRRRVAQIAKVPARSMVDSTGVGEPHLAMRINGIDICRSVAITLAMFSHVFVQFEGSRILDGAGLVTLRFFLQMAPPMFICLFGTMLEVIYVSRVERGEGLAVTQKLLNRSLQCYVLYCVSLAALVLSDKISLLFAIRCALLIGVTPFTDILKFYALVLLIAPILISARICFGLWPLIAYACAVHLAYPLLKSLPEPDMFMGKDYFGPATSFLYGVGGTTVGGPSLLHGLALVTCGMVIGHAARLLLSDNAKQIREGMRWLVILFGISASTALIMWDWSHSERTFRGLSDMSIRNDNHPLYSVVGLAWTLATLTICLYLFDTKQKRWLNGLKFMGSASLFTFCFGNVTLYLLIIKPDSSAMSIGLIGSTFLIIVGQTWLFSFLMAQSQGKEGGTLFLAIWLQTFVQGCQKLLSAFISRPALKYARTLNFVD